MKRKIAAVMLTIMVLFTSCTGKTTPSANLLTDGTQGITDTQLLQAEFPMADFTLENNQLVETMKATEDGFAKSLGSEVKQTVLPTRSVWISFLEYDTMLKGKDQKTFTANVNKMYDRLVSKNINSVIIHARAHGDAYYKSTQYPWASRITGTVDKAPSYDPFKILVDLANKRGLEIHAWINPYRLMPDADMKKLSSKWLTKKWYDSKKRSDFMVNVNGTWWLNPNNVECRKLIYRGVKEILKNYKVNALHIDDYFYSTSLDKYGVTKAQATKSTTTTIRGIYNTVKGVNKRIMFGVSPQGGIDNLLVPSSDKTQYTDLVKWVKNAEYIDYVMPQIYFGFQNQTQPFVQTVNRWQQLVNRKYCKLIIGLGPYKSGTDDTYAGTGRNEWRENTNIIARQIEYLDSQRYIDGFVFFRHDSVFNDYLTGNPALERDNIYKVLTGKIV